MKAERRQELRTNDLAQQIDQVGDYMKQNAATLAAVVIIAATAVGGVFYYIKRQQNTLMSGWAALAQRVEPETEPRLEAYKEVANDNLDPALTVQAWLRVGEAAMHEMFASKKPDAPAESKDWPAIAEDAFSKVLNLSPKDFTAAGQALMGLGLLRENKSDWEGAKTWYKKVIDDNRFADSPLRAQAQYRIDHMADWQSTVVFPSPPPPTSQPATSAPAIAGPTPAMMSPVPEKISASQVPEAVKKAAMEASRSATTQPAGN